MKPYYEDSSGITIYHSDCREWLPSGDAVVSDPPYGIAYQHGARKSGDILGFDNQAIVGDDIPFDPSPFLKYQQVILWGGNHFAHRLPPSGGRLVWDKRDGIAPNDQSDCELAWTNVSKTARLYSRYWNGGGINEERFHPTQKPIGVMRWCVAMTEGVVLDPFMGSGTTLRAAKDLGRKAIGIEIEERYCEIAAKRLMQGVLLTA